jgi:hypothetical protein
MKDSSIPRENRKIVLAEVQASQPRHAAVGPFRL